MEFVMFTDKKILIFVSKKMREEELIKLLKKNYGLIKEIQKTLSKEK